MAAQFALFGVAGWAYLLLLGLAVAPWAMPRRWVPFWPAAVPLVGWAALVAVAYPLNATFPGRPVLIGLGITAPALLAWQLLSRRFRPARPRLESIWPVAVGAMAYAAGSHLYVRAGTTTALVADSDVEHFADVIAALLAFPIGWDAEAQMGLEATPVGLAYHYVHASMSALTGADSFATAASSGLLTLALAPSAVCLFARDGLRLPRGESALAVGLVALGGLPIAVASFGWGQQTAALACAPAAFAALRRGLLGSERRALVGAGLLGALAAGALYLASAPLLGGAAALIAAWQLVRRGSTAPLRRLTAIGVIVLLAGALSHVSAAAFLLGRTSAGLLRADELSGRSTHVTTFASLPAALGVVPLDLFRDALGVSGEALITWRAPVGGARELVSAAAGAALVAAGAWALRQKSAVLAPILVATAAFELYLRVLRPFPYGEFKLLSTVWFLVPVLAAAGAGWLVRRPAAPALATASVAAVVVVFAGGLASVQVHTRALLSTPWGAVLPEAEMAHARRIAAAVPRGEPVWVSNQLAPQSAVDWAGIPSQHRAGFTSPEAGQGYLALRWKGVITSLLAFSGRPVLGLVQRHSTELRAAMGPSAAAYALLDVSEDPLLLGMTETDLMASAGRLRLYRVRRRPVAPWPGSETGGVVRMPVPAAQSPLRPERAVLPIGESLPGRRTGATLPALAPGMSGGSITAEAVALALLASREGEVTVQWGTSSARTIALLPGITWYVTPPVGATSDVRLITGQDVQVLAAVGLEREQAGEQLTRSRLGLAAPFVAPTIESGTLRSTAVNLTRDQISRAGRVRRGPALWLEGRTMSREISLDPGINVLRVDLTEGETRAQQWQWLQIGAPALPSLHEPPLASPRPEDWLPSFFSLPLYGRPAPAPQIENGTLVKGSSARLHLVEQGRLRWVTSLEALQRRGLSPPVVTLPDADLWRLSVGLPLE